MEAEAKVKASERAELPACLRMVALLLLTIKAFFARFLTEFSVRLWAALAALAKRLPQRL